MEFKPTFTKDGAYYLVEIKEFDAMTQGRSKSEAELMIKDWLKGMIDAHFGVKISIKEKKDKNGHMIVIVPDKYAVPFMLYRLRIYNNKTIQEITQACGFKSKNAYAQYEQGRRMPGIEQFAKLLEAMGAKLQITRV